MRISVFVLCSSLLLGGCGGCGGDPSHSARVGAPQSEQEPAVEAVIHTKFEEIGTGLLPAGFSESDLSNIQDMRIKTLENTVSALRARVENGVDGMQSLFAAEYDLAIARLESAKTKQMRLEAIFECQKQALLVWQRIKELERVGAKGGDTVSETIARAHVLRIRELWLKESVAKNP